MEGGWGVYQETTLAAALSGARAMPPGVIFTPCNAGNKLSAPRIDMSSLPPTLNAIQDALASEGCSKEGSRERQEGGV